MTQAQKELSSNVIIEKLTTHTHTFIKQSVSEHHSVRKSNTFPTYVHHTCYGADVETLALWRAETAPNQN